jgi:hypothetical protein
VTGGVGLLCRATSLFWNFYVYNHERPGFIVDCARDFDPPGWGTMGRGAPSGAYCEYDNRTHEVAVQCRIINVGQKAEIVRRIESRLAVSDLAVPSDSGCHHDWRQILSGCRVQIQFSVAERLKCRYGASLADNN